MDSSQARRCLCLFLTAILLFLLIEFDGLQAEIKVDCDNKYYKAQKKLYMFKGNVRREVECNELLYNVRKTYVEQMLNGSLPYLLRKPFPLVRKQIAETSMYKLIRMLPKGGNLLLKLHGGVSSEFIIKNITYMKGIMRCKNREGVTLFTFRYSPERHKCVTPYKLISEERAHAKSIEAYDNELEKLITIQPANENEYLSERAAKKRMAELEQSLNDIVYYIPSLNYYLEQMLNETLEDGLIYFELYIPPVNELYDDNGTYGTLEFLNIFLAIEQKAYLEIDVFDGAIVIIECNRGLGKEEFAKCYETFKTYHNMFPDLVGGVAIVGDDHEPDVEFIDIPSIFTDQPPNSHFLYHTPYKNTSGIASDVYHSYAVTMNISRIFDGTALLRYPVYSKEVKKKNIGIEIGPLWSVMTGRVKDMGEHIGHVYYGQGFPLIISSVTPGYWGASGVSYDLFYVALTFLPYYADMSKVIELFENSFSFASTSARNRSSKYYRFDLEWTKFRIDLEENILTFKTKPIVRVPPKKELTLWEACPECMEDEQFRAILLS